MALVSDVVYKQLK